MTSATWQGVTGHNIPLRVSSLPVTRCLRVFQMVFFQKRRLSFFFRWLKMKRSQNWPDLGSPISKFRKIRFIDTGTDINRWKFLGDRAFGVAMTSIQTSEVRSLGVTWPWVTWVWNFHSMCGKDAWAPSFLDIREKPEGRGVKSPPSQHGAG